MIQIKDDYIDRHIDAVLALERVNATEIKKSDFTIVVDGVNSSGGIAIPKLLDKLQLTSVKIHCTPNGMFPHNH